jgi:hypothetical protein
LAERGESSSIMCNLKLDQILLYVRSKLDLEIDSGTGIVLGEGEIRLFVEVR